MRYHPPPPHGWSEPQVPHPMNGHAFEIAHSLGRLEMQGERQVEIMLGMKTALDSLPEKLAASLPSTPVPPSGPTKGPASSILADRWWLGSMWLLTLIVLKMLGIITSEQLASLLGRLIGGP